MLAMVNVKNRQTKKFGHSVIYSQVSSRLFTSLGNRVYDFYLLYHIPYYGIPLFAIHLFSKLSSNFISTIWITGMMLDQSTTNVNNHESNMLDAEINVLQRENARVESQMMRLKSDISAMETQLIHGDRVRRIRLVGESFIYVWV